MPPVVPRDGPLVGLFDPARLAEELGRFFASSAGYHLVSLVRVAVPGPRALETRYLGIFHSVNDPWVLESIQRGGAPPPLEVKSLDPTFAPASGAFAGVARLSVDPADPEAPVALGANDPVLALLRRTRVIAGVRGTVATGATVALGPFTRMPAEAVFAGFFPERADVVWSTALRSSPGAIAVRLRRTAAEHQFVAEVESQSTHAAVDFLLVLLGVAAP